MMFDFVLAFGGSDTIGFLITPALLCFIENIFIYWLNPWTSMLCSFGRGQNTLYSISVTLIWAEWGCADICKQVNAKVLVLANPSHSASTFGDVTEHPVP